ncbi:MAG: hypothetical protein IJ738_05120 [Alphaproteobacteria bacterium]|nr:hypothetical protein [Alphaproteobacteria bacterium]
MRSQFKRQTNSKVVVYAVVIAVILGICAVVMQEIKVPAEHITQEIEVDLEK